MVLVSRTSHVELLLECSFQDLRSDFRPNNHFLEAEVHRGNLAEERDQLRLDRKRQTIVFRIGHDSDHRHGHVLALHPWILYGEILRSSKLDPFAQRILIVQISVRECLVDDCDGWSVLAIGF